jgi:hypothetical protein
LSQNPLAGGLRAAGEGLAGFFPKLLKPEPPVLAVEFRPRSVSVVRVTRSGEGTSVGAAASLDLSPGVLEVSMTANNVHDPDTLTRTLGAAFQRAGALGGGPVAVVLPDPVARVSLLPAGELQVKTRGDFEPMLRFRLKKSVPFEIDEARVGALFPRNPEDPVLVAAISRPVLEGYEQVLGRLGYDPGQVEIGCLALADRLGSGEGDTALVNWDLGYLSLVILRDGWPILVRTLVGDFTASADSVIRECNNTILYYRERLGGMGLLAAVVRSALLRPEEAVGILREPLGVRPSLFDPWAGQGPIESASASQALAGAASALLEGDAA